MESVVHGCSRYHKRILLSVVVFLLCYGPSSGESAEALSYRQFPLVVVANDKLIEAEKASLPADLITILAPLHTENSCSDVAFFPRAQLMRIDVDPADSITFQATSEPALLEKEARDRLNWVQGTLGVRPDFAQIKGLVIEKLNAMSLPSSIVVRGPADFINTTKLSNVVQRVGTSNVFVLPSPGEDASDLVSRLKGLVPTGLDLKPADTAGILVTKLASELCSTSKQDNKPEVPGFVVWYRPYVAPPPPVRDVAQTPLPSEPSPEAVQHARQGLTYISLAKLSRLPKERRENYDNAVRAFSQAIALESCYANAYMNRGLVYALQQHFNIALRDLSKAAECDANSATIRYNLASVYSLQSQNDLAIESLDKALQLGFNDCASLRGDPDLKHVRRTTEFRETLEKYKLFCF